MSNHPKCSLCGEPMPAGEQMFSFHGFSGPCPKPPLPQPPPLDLSVLATFLAKAHHLDRCLSRYEGSAACDCGLLALRAAVRAERDAAWREGVAADAARYRVLADKSGRWFCQADGMDAWYFSGPVVTLTADMPTMNEYVDALAARMEAK